MFAERHRKAGPNIAGKTKFVTVKKFKCESLVVLIKSRNNYSET